ncbi:Oxysterol-binding protein [Polychaeton citri CBS 116435]|uniref:Oxysterol-binding protein n=1 Tax=Polychaeton citri CBS 116435 TaxID=1314669 RepID=A0A9P4QAB6_9PEZI|nr:Oxysterol-binding protein [Polychaeton citri CBS 116435]
MVLGHSHRKSSLASNRSSLDDPRHSETEDETVVDADQGNVLTHIISQLRPGADLSRVTLPTFILEPRSMLERITNFMAHPETLLPMPDIEDPTQRFVAVTKFYLSGWHIKPPGVKKPLNPILGETFTGWWDYSDGTRGYYISEQTSHHPPKSSYFYMAPEHHIRIDGTLKPRSRFLGNSVGSFMEGIAVMRFLNRNERYFITQPNMYARGILFGKMKYELGDHAVVRCPESGLEADIEFKVKGWVSGSYNAIGGYIKDTKSGKNLFELSGYWHGEMFIKDLTTGKKEVLFDATHAKESVPKSRPISEQAPRESQRLWESTTKAIKKADQKVATDEKSKIEDEQRREAHERGDQEWQPKLFRKAPPGDEENLDWIIDAEVDVTAPSDKQIEQILAIAPVLPGQVVTPDFQKDKALPSQQGKPLPSSGDGSNELIDFGQNDSGASKATAPSVGSVTQQMGGMGLQQPLKPSVSGTNRVVRQDSLGGNDEFVDAES